jgi:bifunctional pyridoxal-dependent enzyme with beta-cystathionase and maltose regulon repressor activities
MGRAGVGGLMLYPLMRMMTGNRGYLDRCRRQMRWRMTLVNPVRCYFVWLEMRLWDSATDHLAEIVVLDVLL